MITKLHDREAGVRFIITSLISNHNHMEGKITKISLANEEGIFS